MTRLIFDAHLDLAWNTASFDRDLTLPLSRLNQSESDMTDVPFRGRATVSFPEMRRTGIAICIGTLLARSGPEHIRQRGYQRVDLDFATRLGCHAAAHAQLSCYHYWEAQGEIRMLKSRSQFVEHWKMWCDAEESQRDSLPIGVVLSMEGADPVMDPNTLEYWWQQGLRAIEPAHYGRSHYASGTAAEGPLTAAGRRLVIEMDRLGIALDVTHLCDESMAEALDLYTGPVWASHHNCRSLVPGDRQLTDEQIRRLCDRDAVIGVALDAWMLYPGWIRRQTDPSNVAMSDVANHIDHVCQLAGNTRHSGIGSDLDGGFGTEQTPGDMSSIFDLQKLSDILAQRGYNDGDIDAIFHGNFVRHVADSLPA